MNSPVQGVRLLQSAAVPGDQVSQVEEQGERVWSNPGHQLLPRLGTRQEPLGCAVSCFCLLVPALVVCLRVEGYSYMGEILREAAPG